MSNPATAAINSTPYLAVAGYVGTHAFGPHTSWSDMGQGFLAPTFWLTCALTIVFGAFGGIAYELLLRQGTIELPHRVPAAAVGRTDTESDVIALGIVGRAMVGAAAALAIQSVLAPNNPDEAVAIAVTAGSAAPALIRLLRRHLVRLTGLLADNQTRQAEQELPGRQTQPQSGRTLRRAAMRSAA